MAACVGTSRITNPSQISQHPNMSQHDENHFRYDFVDFHDENRESSEFVDFPFEEEEEEEEAEKEVGALWLKMKEVGALWLKMKQEQESALANHLSIKLCISSLPSTTLYDIFMAVLVEDQGIIGAVKEDLKAAKERDPACISNVHCFLNYKGFLACQAHRVAHNLWSQGRNVLALLIQNRVSEVFAVDIHPGAKIGSGILFDHATGVVVGETAVIGNNVSILHNVTLGGTGKASGDRHPKIGDGVLIGAGTCILGNIKIGDGAKIGAGSVVLRKCHRGLLRWGILLDW
ncbi:Serine acetyltransferase 3 [Hibiscus syriacus]|uniref:serine O-acetyltransferase n=1 Tax=Hibiscus syriacus TaxID=106335 RepID=A0A6A2W9T8_HIBSY|nr:Serine acetyltransferase 3 [Hibiscus syriacus]